ncbi:hypothetical protein CYLTODRAFT_419751 [Cylindrobasidium torrendii FP15055 ss-10]|uniref:Activator of Hsp90 ATPase AHSA1-like N-terminal domain-containing protein n=1 Tax=Cylindrobasidium torrendii FP15055 ss-10 TaxID=1314674 RepID=A0A0D7BJI1_9AGAR|nr:hypothetical protein CYLTODRAFT_419751 [Cylindrobasidium torrendii FP15055 ss-10]
MSVPAPMAASTANWHWKNKNVTSWGHQWFKDTVGQVKVTGEKEGEAVWVHDVTDVDGDVELGQRKSKLITIFDLRLTVHWTGTASDGSEVKGRVDIPEVSHENTCDSPEKYEYQWRLHGVSTPEAQAVLKFARAELPALLDAAFRKFPAAMLEHHGKDLTVAASNQATPTASGTSTPAPVAEPKAAPVAVKKPAAKALNTSKIEVEGTFAASADDLFTLLTDQGRISLWTRAPAQSSPQPGGEYVLFGGGVKGKYISLEPGKQIVQTWALSSPTWPTEHSAELKTTLTQGSDSTTVKFALSGVPTGLEDEIKRNLEGYYIQGFKSIGLGTSL